MFNDDWRNELEEFNYDCYERLCECRNTKTDIVTMSRLMCKYNPHKKIEECVERIIEWVTDWNNQYYLSDWAYDNFDKMVVKFKKEFEI